MAGWIRASTLGADTVRAVASDSSGAVPWGPADVGNGDGGKADLASASLAGQRVFCWSDERSASAAIYAQNVHEDGTLGPGDDCVADLSGDGVVGADDLLAVIGVWGLCVDCPADFTGDDLVGTDDLLIVLAGWGPC